MREFLDRERVSLWLDYLQLPIVNAVLNGAYIAHHVEPKEAVVLSGSYTGDVKLDRDNKWTSYGRHNLCAAAWEEDAPPLNLQLRVPNGSYIVSVKMPALKKRGRVASSLQIDLQSSQNSQEVLFDYSTEEDYIDVGKIEIADGYFKIAFRQSNADHWACLSKIRLVPERGDSQSSSTMETPDTKTPEELLEHEEALRALGYL
jgi:hypothetical protein